MWQLSPISKRFLNTVYRDAADKVTQKAQQRRATKYEVAMCAFNNAPFGHPLKHEFLLLLWQLMWPHFFILNIKEWHNFWCVRMAQAFCSEKRISMMGCASSGKTFTTAMYGYTLWKVKPHNTSVYLSSTTGEGLEARMFGAIKDLYAKDRFRIGKRIDSMQMICLDDEVRDEEGEKQRDYRDVIKCIKIKSGNEGQNVVGTICGRKNDNVLWVADELAHMDIGVLSARVNLFSNDFAQFIGIGNAPEEGTPLYLDAEPYGDDFPDGFRSVDKDVQFEWPTKVGKCLYFNGADSPNFQIPKGTKGFPKIMDEAKREEIWLTAGREENAIYWVQFYGFPPGIEISNKVITHALLKEGNAYDKPEWLGVGSKWVAGMDCGFRAGGDPTVIHFWRIGKASNGDTVLDSAGEDGVALIPTPKSTDSFEMQMAKKTLDLMKEKGCSELAIDISGDGGMTAVALQNEAKARGFKLTLTPISSMGEPDDRVTVPGERRKASEMFDRKVSQLWTTFRLLVQKKLVRGMPKSGKCTNQLCARRFGQDERKRFSIEKKVDMKKRTKKSPDHADALIYGAFLALSHGVALAPEPKGRDSIFPENNIPAPKYSGHATRARYSG